jgi:rfaE bifunctional protein kinase chain/domain
MKIKPKRILVIGDSFLDTYIEGEANRLSQEAPVPVVLVKNPPKHKLGGAANTAANVVSLGGVCTLVTLLGDDRSKADFADMCQYAGVELRAFYDGRPTNVKTRILAQGQQLLRLDAETTETIKQVRLRVCIISEVRNLVKRHDIVIISDYAKGFIWDELMQEIKDVCARTNVPIIVDPKPKNKVLYRNVSYITPNREEMLGMMPFLQNVDEAACAFSRENQCGVLLTKGADGITLISGGEVKGNWPTQAKEVFDVTGAGDTVVAAFALALASGGAEEEAINFANKAAGIAVSKHGTTAVKLEEVK